MSVLSQYTEKIRTFKARFGLPGTEKDLAATIHLMSIHNIDKDKALDQCSQGNNDHGIDGWYLDENSKSLNIYQSKCSEIKGIVIEGLNDLVKASNWLDQAINKGELDTTPNNHALINLHKALAGKKSEIQNINFHLISPFSESELVTVNSFDKAHQGFGKADAINKFNKSGVGISLSITPYNFSNKLPVSVTKYVVEKLPNTTKVLSGGAELHLSYLSLYSLVKLYEERGDYLFHKNIRLSLLPLKKTSKHRVISPMKQTLDEICNGELDSDIFSFYHGGITIYATSTEPGIHKTESLLEAPFVLNGCQTITIAHSFFKEIQCLPEKVEVFKRINVIAKIVENADADVVREITICNNRHNPIEDWQLYSNDPIHCNIEFALKDLGVFYERQMGRFESENKKTDFYLDYPNTNATYVGLEQLGQVISLCKRNHQFVAKKSLIFSTSDHHKDVFTDEVHNYAKDMIYCSNLFKAVGTATTYAIKEAYSTQENKDLFKKPIVRAHIWWLLLICYYQKKAIFEKAAINPYKKAISSVIEEIKIVALSKGVIRKVKSFLENNINSQGEVSVKKLTPFFERELAIELGIDLKSGVIPFTKNSKFL